MLVSLYTVQLYIEILYNMKLWWHQCPTLMYCANVALCYAILDVVGLKSHPSTYYKYLPITARFTTDTLG